MTVENRLWGSHSRRCAAPARKLPCGRRRGALRGIAPLHRSPQRLIAAITAVRRAGSTPIREGALSFRRHAQDNGDSIDNYDGSVTGEIRASLEISSTAFGQSNTTNGWGRALASLIPPSVILRMAPLHLINGHSIDLAFLDAWKSGVISG
jgi:hypothetical protein